MEADYEHQLSIILILKDKIKKKIDEKKNTKKLGLTRQTHDLSNEID